MKLSRILCVVMALFVISTSSYAIEVSVGTSLGAGFPIFRGATYNAYSAGIDKVYPDAKKLGYSLVMPTIDVMVEILPVFAIETGVGYRYSTWQSSYTNAGGSHLIDSFTRSEIYIPIMLRGQSKYGIGTTYVSVGVKIGFPLSSSYSVQKIYIDEKFSSGTINAEPAKFVLDASFVVGQEFKIVDTHYIGIRATYDLNILKPFSPRENNTGAVVGLSEKSEWFQDNLTFALTYRYAFAL